MMLQRVDEQVVVSGFELFVLTQSPVKMALLNSKLSLMETPVLFYMLIFRVYTAYFKIYFVY
jgi:hypothetical protein